jgi:hypothetical protein
MDLREIECSGTDWIDLLRISTYEGLMWTFCFHKIFRNSEVIAKLEASEEGLISMELVSLLPVICKCLSVLTSYIPDILGASFCFYPPLLQQLLLILLFAESCLGSEATFGKYAHPRQFQDDSLSAPALRSSRTAQTNLLYRKMAPCGGLFRKFVFAASRNRVQKASVRIRSKEEALCFCSTLAYTYLAARCFYHWEQNINIHSTKTTILQIVYYLTIFKLAITKFMVWVL